MDYKWLLLFLLVGGLAVWYGHLSDDGSTSEVKGSSTNALVLVKEHEEDGLKKEEDKDSKDDTVDDDPNNNSWTEVGKNGKAVKKDRRKSSKSVRNIQSAGSAS